MQNLENMDVFEIIITQKLLNARRTLLSDSRSNTIDLKTLEIFQYFDDILQVLKLKFQKFRILEMLNFHPCTLTSG